MQKDDVIYRQAAIEAMEYSKELCSATLDNLDYNMAKNEFYLEQINDDIDTIKGLPSAQPEPQWIPCSERLPEDGVRVLITDRDGGIEFGHYEDGEWEWLCESGTNYWSGLNSETVIAWMPLPEPYKEENR